MKTPVRFTVSNTDAKVWAKEFMKTWKEHAHDPIWIDEELMTAWFANAIMAGYGEGKRR